MLNRDSINFYMINIGIPLLCAVAIFFMFDLTNIDLTISNHFFDKDSQRFPFDQMRIFELITHKKARIIPDLTGGLAITCSLLSFVWPRLHIDKHKGVISVLEKFRIAPLLKFFALHRRDFLFVAIAFSVSTGTVHFFKSHTGVYCPVETTIYGGKFEKKEWYENFSLLHEVGKARCWPAGHASGGFAMCALYFVARRYRWRHAKALLYGTLLLGFVFGTTRVMQGWHYMSHTLWSGVVVWLATLLTALAFYGRKMLDQPVIK